eukprot:g4883.t1
MRPVRCYPMEVPFTVEVEVRPDYKNKQKHSDSQRNSFFPRTPVVVCKHVKYVRDGLGVLKWSALSQATCGDSTRTVWSNKSGKWEKKGARTDEGSEGNKNFFSCEGEACRAQQQTVQQKYTRGRCGNKRVEENTG